MYVSGRAIVGGQQLSLQTRDVLATYTYEGKTCDALREYLRNNRLPTSGKKAVLIQR